MSAPAVCLTIIIISISQDWKKTIKHQLIDCWWSSSQSAWSKSANKSNITQPYLCTAYYQLLNASKSYFSQLSLRNDAACQLCVLQRFSTMCCNGFVMQRITPAVSHTLVTCVTRVTELICDLAVTGPTGPDWTRLEEKGKKENGLTWSLWCAGSPRPKCPALGKSAGAVATMPFEKVDTMLTGLLLAERLKSYQAPDRTSGWPDDSQLAEEVIWWAGSSSAKKREQLDEDRHQNWHQSCGSGLRRGSQWIFEQTDGQSKEVSLGNSLDQWPMTTLPSFFSFFILLSFHTHIAILILTRKRSIVRILNSVGDRGRHNRGIHNLSGFHMHRQTACLNTYGTALITFHVLFSTVCLPERRGVVRGH